MSAFTVQVSGVTVEDWLDPAPSGGLSRLNPRQGRPLRRYVGAVTVPITLTAVTPGTTPVVGPEDVPGDALFVCEVVESPYPRPEFLRMEKSSVQRFVPSMPGHYHLRMRKHSWGIVHVHLDVMP
jgi:hypothetical protein